MSGRKLTDKQRLFVEEYLKCWNATEAATLAEYAHPNKQGPRLLVNVGIRAAIEERLEVKALEADEVLKGLAEIATGSMADFIQIGMCGGVWLDMLKAEAKQQLHLIKKLKFKDGLLQSVELYDRQAALVQLGRHHRLFVDKVEIDWRRDLERAGVTQDDYEEMVQALTEKLITQNGDV